VSRDVEISNLYVGKVVLLYTKLNSFQKPKNPQYFDYAGFMNNRNVYAIINDDHFVSFSVNDFSINAISSKYRQNLVSALEEAGFKENHLKLMQALILGQKQAINKETYNDFAEVGVVHILAVSGLHVGIVLLIIQFLLKPLGRLPKYGKTLKVILSIMALWCFAALAGFSPSVMRASTMFTFLAFGQLFRRKTNTINMLCLSAVVLLLINPQFIFEVGFQLSYAAVFSIIMLYPVFSKLYRPKFWIPRLFVYTAYVSLAAQIGVLPFTLFYFHQFPGLFLLGNLVIIPFLGLLLSGGILCIALALVGWLIQPVMELYALLLDAMLFYVDWLSQFKAFIFQNIYYTQSMFITSLLLILAFIMMLSAFKKTSILAFLSMVMVFIVTTIFEISRTNELSELIIFHKGRNTLVGIKQGKRLVIYTDKLTFNRNSYLIQNYTLLNQITEVRFDSLQNFYQLQDSKLIVVDSSGVYMDEPKGEIVLLSNSPDIHIEKLIQSLQPKQIIADGNNYRSYVKRWSESADMLSVKFHSTFQEGALRYRLPTIKTP
jgi:competence protein ComEC